MELKDYLKADIAELKAQRDVLIQQAQAQINLLTAQIDAKEKKLAEIDVAIPRGE